MENDYLPPNNDESEVSEPTTLIPTTSTTTTTIAPSTPSNEYLPAADPITNDYLPPSIPSSDESACVGSECDEQTITVTNEVIV